jgi:putative methyltransferase
VIKKTVNMIEVNYIHENSAFFPYATGTLVAYAKSNEAVTRHYSFEDIFFIRENTDELAKKIKDSFIVGFSNSIWNFEYNKVLAKKIKAKNPECIIVFGGHSIHPNGALLDEHYFFSIG